MIRESLSLAYEQQQLTKSANITCKRCSDRKFEESIMDSQFAAIYFQNIGIAGFLDFGLSGLALKAFITAQSFSLAEYLIRAACFINLQYLS